MDHGAIDIIHDIGLFIGSVAAITKTWLQLDAFIYLCGRREAAQNPLPVLVVSMIEPAQQDLEICVVRDVDWKDLSCDATIESLGHAVRLGRVGPGLPLIHPLAPACFLERIRSET